jgi:hypothetical protein
MSKRHTSSVTIPVVSAVPVPVVVERDADRILLDTGKGPVELTPAEADQLSIVLRIKAETARKVQQKK